MAATVKKAKQYDNPMTDGSNRVKVHLGWGQYMDQSKREVLRLQINGYELNLEFGKTHEVPEAYVKLIENARIRYIKQSALNRYEHGVGGQGRPQSEVLENDAEYADIPMYNLVRL